MPRPPGWSTPAWRSSPTTDRMLLEVRGEVRAATGDPEGALADWRRAVDLDQDIGPVYSSAFLLERWTFGLPSGHLAPLPCLSEPGRAW
jgi:hypothetical protein